jgi:hypothetical protein
MTEIRMGTIITWKTTFVTRRSRWTHEKKNRRNQYVTYKHHNYHRRHLVLRLEWVWDVIKKIFVFTTVIITVVSATGTFFSTQCSLC